MAFRPIGSLNPHGAPVLRKEIITNSVTVDVTNSVKLASGFVALNTAGALTFGHVVGIVTSRDVGVETTGAAGAESGSFVGTFAAASDNQTVAQVKAEVDISKFTLYTVDPDDTIGTTTGSNLSGYNTDIADEDNTDEDTAATTTAQYHIWGVDALDSGNQVVNIYESQVFGV